VPALRLPTVTLCAAASVNVLATLAALRSCLAQASFAECLFFTDVDGAPDEAGIRTVRIPKLESAEAYSQFLLHGLLGYLHTDHCLVVQWDGFILDAGRWDPAFLSYDYIGAPWPQFTDGHDVGNGGFSLRSRKLLQACRDPRFRPGHPEDVSICRVNRAMLEREHDIRFADRDTASAFAYERMAGAHPSFGFHGIFNMVSALGTERFWDIYASLDHRRTILPDYGLLLRQLSAGGRGLPRMAKLTLDMIAERLKLRRTSV